MKKHTVVIVGLIVIAALSVWVYQKNQNSQKPSEPADLVSNKPQESQLAEADNGGVDTVTEPEPTSAQTVREFRSMLNPSTQKENPEEMGLSEKKLREIEEIALSASAGNPDAFKDLRKRARDCRDSSHTTEAELAFELGVAERRYQIKLEQAENEPPSFLESAELAYESQLDSILFFSDLCAWMRAPGYRRFREDLSRMASQGDVVARYAYAMLFKPWRGATDYKEEMVRWRELANIHTDANVNERQTMGFAAKARSFNTGIFTIKDQLLSNGWLYLLVTCPKLGPTPANYLDQFQNIDPESDFKNGDTVRLGQQLKEMHCP